MSGAAVERRLGLVGLGAVGYRLAARLLERYETLVLLDRDGERLDRALGLGGEAAADAANLGAICDVVLLSLPSPAAVKEVMEGPRGLLAGIRAGAIVLDTSTLDPARRSTRFETCWRSWAGAFTISARPARAASWESARTRWPAPMSYVLDGIFRTRLSNPSGRAHFAMELMAKDHRLMDALARKQGIELPMNRRALELCEEMCEAGYARRDNVASVEYFRKRNGLA